MLDFTNRGTIIEEMPEAEREAYLGYPRHKRKPEEHKEDGNSRNGYTHKTVRSSHGDIKLDIPRDRNGDFQPELIRKYDNDIPQIEDWVLSMYARGMSVRDIQSHLEDIYGASISAQTISNMTDSILPVLEEWRNRAFKEIYSIVYIDGQRFKVRCDGTVKDKTMYTFLAIDLEGHKDLLGLWISETESTKYWLSVMTEIRNRGVKYILIITSDDLPGIEELQVKWGDKYPLAINAWERNWDRISTMFRFTEEIRKLIYTTNPVESVHSQFRKATGGKGHFPDDTSVMKVLYLASQKMIKRWTIRVPN